MHFHIGNCSFCDRSTLYPRGSAAPFRNAGRRDSHSQVRDYFRILLDMKLLNPEKKPVLSAEVRPLLAEETSEVVLANTKRVIKEAWAMV